MDAAIAKRLLRILAAAQGAGADDENHHAALIALIGVVAGLLLAVTAVVAAPSLLFDGGAAPEELAVIRQASGLTHPCPGMICVSGEAGMRFHPIQHVWRAHTGIDLAADGGTPILAAGDGVISFSDWDGGYGNCIIIDHSDTLQTLYAHMMLPGLPAGTKVKAGDVIGYVGTTGNSTGNHLHFEVLVDGQWQNPRDYIDF